MVCATVQSNLLVKIRAPNATHTNLLETCCGLQVVRPVQLKYGTGIRGQGLVALAERLHFMALHLANIDCMVKFKVHAHAISNLKHVIRSREQNRIAQFNRRHDRL
jgi:hypothetical protein